VASLSVGVIAFINSSWFDVDVISVVGAEKADPELVIEASGIRPGQGLLELDLDASSRSVELVPWVGSATVDRGWDGSIEIAVTERGPAAAITAGSRFALVDDHGRQLEIVDQRPEGYLSIEGIDGSGVAGEAAPATILPVIAVLEALPPGTAERISAVVVADDDINLVLAGGGRANLGEGSELGPKLQAFETVLARVDLSCLETIDLRVPSAPVVTRTTDLPPVGAGAGVQNDHGGNPDSPPPDC
jgi:cell division protein FtsQ